MVERRFDMVQQILRAALRQSMDERAQFVQAACADDLELMHDVLLRLNAQESGLADLATAVGEPGAAPEASTSTPGIVRALLTDAGADRLTWDASLDEGGMGVVEIVKDHYLGRRIARKTLRYGDCDPASVRRFLREVRITALLGHPSIVPVHDVGETQDGRPYFTMKLIEGQNLSKRLSEFPEGPLSRTDLWECLDVVVRVCEALAHAHRRGIIHCDVKPSNIMTGELGEVYLMDWGIAKVMGETGDVPVESIVQDGAPDLTSQDILGSPAYMAPEQARGYRTHVDARTDVFGVGALLYEIAHRRPPRATTATLGAAVKQAAEEPIAPLGPDVPAGLRRIIARALAFEPTDRYATIVELRTDLVKLMRGELELTELFVEAGHVVCKKGDQAEAAYQIKSGACHVYADQACSGAPLWTMQPGDIFGEIALFGDGRRTASIVAAEPTVLKVIDRDLVERELTTLPRWMVDLVRGLVQRFRAGIGPSNAPLDQTRR